MSYRTVLVQTTSGLLQVSKRELVMLRRFGLIYWEWDDGTFRCYSGITRAHVETFLNQVGAL